MTHLFQKQLKQQQPQEIDYEKQKLQSQMIFVSVLTVRHFSFSFLVLFFLSQIQTHIAIVPATGKCIYTL